MAKLHKKVIAALRQSFVDVVDALEEVKSTGRVTGVVISPSFRRLGFDKRQDRLWKALEKELTKAELDSVGPIIAMTPAEASVGAH